MADYEKHNWSYSNSEEWGANFPNCKNNNTKQSPINIDTNKIKDIGNLQSLGILYGPSKCHVMNKNNTPTIKYDPNSYINFAGVLYELQKITLHTPSMHTINGNHYNMEMCLYHCSNPSECSENGIIISILMKRGRDSSKQNMFFNQFINQLPKGESKFEKEIPVTADWNVMSALPDNKSFFYYEGSYPMPPCKPNWKWIIFEEVIEIGSTNFETFELVTKYSDTLGNIRIPTKPLGTRNVFYQNNPHLLTNDKINIENIKQQIKDLQDKQKNIEERNENKAQFEVEKDKTTETKLKIQEQNKNEFNTWYKEHKLFIKGILITIIMLGILFTGLKITKKIVNEDILTNFITNELNKAEIREKEKAELEASSNNMMGPPPGNAGAPLNNNLGPSNL